ncbi:MAG: hypothetical protein SGJ27_03675 [Candidatus Melainabacteria bacterium]|nr:hypothetical protein [Candidatus Melainabacteria bacterium]
MTSSLKTDDRKTSFSQEESLDPKFLLGLSVVILTAMVVSIASFWYAHPVLQWPDQSMYLGMADLYLDGYRPYVDMVDFNPPLILYINLIPAMMARAFHLHIIVAFSGFVIGLIVLSLLLSGFMMWQQKSRKEAFFYLPILMGFVYSTQDLTFDFGQREHLLILTYLPFFVLRYFRWNDAPINKYLAILCGLYAGSCLSLKPHFLIMAAAPELIYLLQTRKWRPIFKPEVFAVGAFGLIYGAHFIFIDPAVREQFFSFVIPLVKNGYDYYCVSSIKILADFSRPNTYSFVAALLMAFFMRRSCPFLAPVSAFTLSSFVIYLFASQDWSHHWYPVLFGSYVLIALEMAVAIRFLCRASEHARLINLYMSSVLVAVVVLGVSARNIQAANPPPDVKRFDLKEIGYQGSCPFDDLGVWGDLVLKNTSKGDKILFISDAIAPGYPSTLQTERKPASRYLHGMPLMMAKYLAFEKDGVKDKEQFESWVQRIIQEYGEDIAKNKPTLIVIRNTGIMEPLKQGQFFEKYMTNYEQFQNIDEHFIYHRKK